ncbi:hypothetical protein EKE94_13310 [Mesobaculum littorinae]|uniref:Uncharacterized protein n=1 Tax=Mesobaculum littorinae TaxID=2486419 RepID=A0A438AFX3_9RHOB|nr:hypothetical protein [Mesobaculum littorinae]RVV97515.1 hypothetical protein EKE94_13310 [Mesobaculum littorinae]
MAEDTGNPDRLRKSIDNGEAGDKAVANDPAASPLGTDDEAGGTPATKSQVAHAEAIETSAEKEHQGSADAAEADFGETPAEMQNGSSGRGIVIACAVVAVVLVVLWLVL